MIMVFTKDADNPYIVTHFQMRTGAADPDPLQPSPRTLWREFSAERDAAINAREEEQQKVLEQFNNLRDNVQQQMADMMFAPNCMCQEKICRLLIHLYKDHKLCWNTWECPFTTALDKEKNTSITNIKHELWVNDFLKPFMHNICANASAEERLRLCKLSFTPFNRQQNDDDVKRYDEFLTVANEHPFTWPSE